MSGFSVAFGSTGYSGSAGGRAAFAPVECRREVLGGSEGMLPREICKIEHSKMQFPAFPEPELGNQNYHRERSVGLKWDS